MDNGQLFILAIIAISMSAGLVRFGIMAKHGYPLDDHRNRNRMRRAMRRGPFGLTVGGMAVRDDDDGYGPAAQRKIDLLSNENEKLTGQISRLEERLRVLERIATDPAERTAREIDALRDRD